MKRRRWCGDIDDGGGDREVVAPRRLSLFGNSRQEGVGGIGGGVGDESAAAAVLAVGLEGSDWHVRLWPYLSLCKK